MCTLAWLGACCRVCLFVCLLVCLFVYLFVWVSLSLFYLCVFMCMYVCTYIHLSECLFIFLSVYICKSIFLSICLSACLSAFPSALLSDSLFLEFSKVRPVSVKMTECKNSSCKMFAASPSGIKPGISYSSLKTKKATFCKCGALLARKFETSFLIFDSKQW